MDQPNNLALTEDKQVLPVTKSANEVEDRSPGTHNVLYLDTLGFYAAAFEKCHQAVFPA
jgi:hypothetical protein